MEHDRCRLAKLDGRRKGDPRRAAWFSSFASAKFNRVRTDKASSDVG